jgi:hypothetical protein
MQGALVFLGAFILFLAITLVYADLPPGKQIYDALNVPSTDYQLLGIPIATLVKAIFNGVIYGVIVWLIYSIAVRLRKPKQKTQQSEKKQ